MPEFDFDLYVIGAGSGGVRCARMSASYGARVAVAEERYLGGTCVNVGCVPKKLFSYGSHFSESFEDAAGYGWDVGAPSLVWQRLIENKNQEIKRLNGIYRNLLKNSDVTIHEARATLKDRHTVIVNNKEITADKILIATGGWPTVPNIPGSEYAITSNEAFFLNQLPKNIIIVGGGYIAVEFAGIFHGYGAHVTQLYRGELFLRGFDQDLRFQLAEEMKKQGIDLRFNSNITAIEKENDSMSVRLEGGSNLDADLVMYATGRVPNTRGLGLEELGVKMKEDGSIVVDNHFRTSVDNIYALGDVIDRFQLTPVAIAEAMILSANLFNGQNWVTDYSDIPTAVFSHPNIGTVGLSEEQAKAKYDNVEIYVAQFRPMLHTLTGRNETTLMKLVVDKSSDRVVGCHMLGSEAGEIIQGLAVAIKAGATKSQFDATVGIHPTSAEEFVTMRESRK